MWIKDYFWKPLFYRWVIICSEDLKYFSSMFTQSRSWGPYPTVLFPSLPFPGCWILLTPPPPPPPQPEKGWPLANVTGSPWSDRACVVHLVLHSNRTASFCKPEFLPGHQLIFSRCRESRESLWQEIEVFYPVKNHRRPYFEFLTLTSVQRCWSDYHLSGLRAGQLMTRVLLDLDLGELERASVGPLWKTPSARALVSEKLWSFSRDWIEICLFWLWRKCLWS